MANALTLIIGGAGIFIAMIPILWSTNFPTIIAMVLFVGGIATSLVGIIWAVKIMTNRPRPLMANLRIGPVKKELTLTTDRGGPTTMDVRTIPPPNPESVLGNSEVFTADIMNDGDLSLDVILYCESVMPLPISPQSSAVMRLKSDKSANGEESKKGIRIDPGRTFPFVILRYHLDGDHQGKFGVGLAEKGDENLIDPGVGPNFIAVCADGTHGGNVIKERAKFKFGSDGNVPWCRKIDP